MCDASLCLSRKNSLNLHGNGCTVVILRLPSVARQLRPALRTAGFYFLGNLRDYRCAERKVEGEAVPAPSRCIRRTKNSAISQPSLAVWNAATENNSERDPSLRSGFRQEARFAHAS